MSGHVFVLQGDLRRIAVDAWLLPSSEHLSITSTWLEGASDAIRSRVGPNRRLDADVPDEWAADGIRVMRVEGWWDDDVPHTWLANVTEPGAPIGWYLEAVDQFVDRAARELAGRTPCHGRDRPLLALPVVGTGGGGAARQRGEMIERLLLRLQEHARGYDVDLVLVTNDDRSFAAAQWARRHQLTTPDAALRLWPDLSEELLDHARQLASEAAAGKLVLFIGAGVSASAGLPLWPDLLTRLAEVAGFEEEQRSAMTRLHPLDQARLIESRLERQQEELTQLVLDQLHSERYGLSHGLLACLPIDQTVTTNYDKLYEQASAAAGRPVAVLPTEPTRDLPRWLLKLHGSIDDPGGIVLTRQDVLRYAERRAALAGIVQALLITHRMMFVGFSMSDENFHRIADDVRRSLGPPAADGQTFGTTLLLRRDPLLAELWGGDVNLVAMGDTAVPTAPAARRLEIFLDCLVTYASDNSAHLLDPDFAGLLSEDERQLKEALLELRAASRAHPSGMWSPVRDLLTRYGTSDESPSSSAATHDAPREPPTDERRDDEHRSGPRHPL